MKRFRLYVVVDLEDDADDSTLPVDVANVLDGVIGAPQFVAVRPGYADEFVDLGADASGWVEPPPSPDHDSLTCDQSPCDLCTRRAELEGIFVALPGGTFLCSSCLAVHPEIDPGDPQTDVWEVGGYGWTGPVECGECKHEIDVVIGEEAKSE